MHHTKVEEGIDKAKNSGGIPKMSQPSRQEYTNVSQQIKYGQAVYERSTKW